MGKTTFTLRDIPVERQIKFINFLRKRLDIQFPDTSPENRDNIDLDEYNRLTYYIDYLEEDLYEHIKSVVDNTVDVSNYYNINSNE